VHRLREAFDLDRSQLPEQAVYRASTIEGLATFIDAVLSGGPRQPDEPTPLLVTLRKGS
ncbi:unnamed protein product, partial [marine sediment metagenome]